MMNSCRTSSCSVPSAKTDTAPSIGAAWLPPFRLQGAFQIRQLGAVRIAPLVVTMAPVVRVELARVEALELLGMTLAHLNDAEARGEMSPRLPLLMAIRDKLALALREEP